MGLLLVHRSKAKRCLGLHTKGRMFLSLPLYIKLLSSTILVVGQGRVQRKIHQSLLSYTKRRGASRRICARLGARRGLRLPASWRRDTSGVDIATPSDKAEGGVSTPGECVMEPHYHEGRRSLDASPHRRGSKTLHCVPGLQLSKWGGAMPLYPERVHVGAYPRAQ